MKLGIVSMIVVTLAGIMPLPFVEGAPVAPRPPSQVSVASKNLAEARARLVKAKAETDVIRRRLLVNYEPKPEWKAAKEALDNAKSDLESAAKKAVAALASDPNYKELVDKRAKATATVDAGAKRTVASTDDGPKLTDDDVNKAQQDRVDSIIAMKKMEHDAYENDAKFVAARQKEKEAQQAWDALQSQLDEAVKLDPAYPPMKVSIDAAEAGVKTAQDAYNNAVKAQASIRPHK